MGRVVAGRRALRAGRSQPAVGPAAALTCAQLEFAEIARPADGALSAVAV